MSDAQDNSSALRIYCEYNDRLDDERFALSCFGSREDLERNAHLLRNGMRVLLYQTDELEAEGTIHFDEKLGSWIRIPDFRTMRYIGRSAEMSEEQANP